jgi:hypothetical protein
MRPIIGYFRKRLASKMQSIKLLIPIDSNPAEARQKVGFNYLLEGDMRKKDSQLKRFGKSSLF